MGPALYRCELTDHVLTIEIPMKPAGAVALGVDAFGELSAQLLEDGKPDEVRRIRRGFHVAANGQLE